MRKNEQVVSPGLIALVAEMKMLEVQYEKTEALKTFQKRASFFGAELKEPRAYLPLDFIFKNPNISDYLECFNSCDIYTTVYGYQSQAGLIVKNLPCSNNFDLAESVKMMDILKRFLAKQQITFVAVLKEIHYREGQSISKLFVYHFDDEKYRKQQEVEIERNLAYS